MAHPKKNSSLKSSSHPVSILICDDDEGMRDTLKAMLDHMIPNSRFFTTSSSAEGIDIVKSRNLDIVISDLHLSPTDSGEKLAELAGSLGLLSILLTGDVASATRHQNLSKNGVYILAKPVSLAELSSAVASVRKIAS